MCVPEENTKRAYCNWFRVFNALRLWATKRRLIIPSRHAAQLCVLARPHITSSESKCEADSLSKFY